MAFHNNACAASKKSGLWNLLTRWPTTPTASSSGGSSAPKTDHPIPKRGDEPSSSRFSLPVSGGAPPARKRLTDFCPPFIIRKEKNPCITTVGGGVPVSLLELKEVTVSFGVSRRPSRSAGTESSQSVRGARGIGGSGGPLRLWENHRFECPGRQVVPTSGQVRLAGEPVQGILPSVGYISQADTCCPGEPCWTTWPGDGAAGRPQIPAAGNRPAAALYQSCGFALRGKRQVLHQGVIPEKLIFFEMGLSNPCKMG